MSRLPGTTRKPDMKQRTFQLVYFQIHSTIKSTGNVGGVFDGSIRSDIYKKKHKNDGTGQSS